MVVEGGGGLGEERWRWGEKGRKRRLERRRERRVVGCFIVGILSPVAWGLWALAFSLSVTFAVVTTFSVVLLLPRSFGVVLCVAHIPLRCCVLLWVVPGPLIGIGVVLRTTVVEVLRTSGSPSPSLSCR